MGNAKFKALRERGWSPPWAFAVLTIVLPVAWLLWGPALEDRWIGFRDAANYYQPLFAWEAGEWGEGRIPLWNPHDNCGTPAVADATSSVFYPGKLIYLLPFSLELRFHLYLVLHVVLAAGTAYWLARCWTHSREAAALAAVAYSLGGNVLFQTSNVVFLIGAAWLPLAGLTIDRLLRNRSLSAAVGFGIVLALMTLGGDPQMAYHALLGAVLYWAILAWSERRTAGTTSTSQAGCSPVKYRVALLAVAAGTGFSLAAVQILPSMVWTNVSDRASYEQPRSLPELASRTFQRDAESLAMSLSNVDAPNPLWSSPQAGTHHEHSYQFSIGPWRLVEYLWPNVYGGLFPANRRWISALPAEGRVWTPSMYLGLLPLVLALSCLRLRGGCPRQRWLSWGLVLATAASFGWYGIGWVLLELWCGLLGATSNSFPIGPQVGGLYWLMATVLPGYIYFRYPAKLMVIAALAASLLAAAGWDRTWKQTSVVPRLLSILGGISVCLAGATWLLKTSFYRWVADAPVDQAFGPLDSDGAYLGLIRAFLHTALLCFGFRAAIGHGTSATLATSTTLASRAVAYRRIALVVTVCEIVIANGPMLVTVPGATLRAPARLASQVHDDAIAQAITATPRAYRDTSLATPLHWQNSIQANRLTEVVTWERQTLLPKHHLTNDISLIESFSTLSSRDFRMLMQIARESGPRLSDSQGTGMQGAPNQDVLNLFSTQYFLVAEPEDPDHPTDLDAAVTAQNVVQVYNPNSFPRAWIVHRVVCLPPLVSWDPRVLRRRTRDVLFDRDQSRDFSQVAVVESDDDQLLPAPQPAGDQQAFTNDEFCRIVKQSPQRVELRCRLRSAGLVVMNELNYPGWRAYVRRLGQADRAECEILRTNRVMRSVKLPAGEFLVEFVYRPREFYGGAAVSVAGWLIVLVWSVLVCRGQWGATPAFAPRRSASLLRKH